MVEVEPIGGNQELRIGVEVRILVDFGIKLKLESFGLGWWDVGIIENIAISASSLDLGLD